MEEEGNDVVSACDADATLGRYRNASAAFRTRIGPVGIEEDEDDEAAALYVRSGCSFFPMMQTGAARA